jgi:hypothetical protein
MLQFPSLDWFSALRSIVNANPDRFRRLGTVDLALVAKVDYLRRSELFEIVFSGYRCVSVRQLDREEQAAKDAVILEGPFEVWRETIENIEANGKADLTHTLNTLTLLDTPMRVRAENQLDVDLFYRYQQNLQEFFDGAAQLKTSFGEVESERATG